MIEIYMSKVLKYTSFRFKKRASSNNLIKLSKNVNPKNKGDRYECSKAGF